MMKPAFRRLQLLWISSLNLTGCCIAAAALLLSSGCGVSKNRIPEAAAKTVSTATSTASSAKAGFNASAHNRLLDDLPEWATILPADETGGAMSTEFASGAIPSSASLADSAAQLSSSGSRTWTSTSKGIPVTTFSGEGASSSSSDVSTDTLVWRSSRYRNMFSSSSSGPKEVKMVKRTFRRLPSGSATSSSANVASTSSSISIPTPAPVEWQPSLVAGPVGPVVNEYPQVVIPGAFAGSFEGETNYGEFTSVAHSGGSGGGTTYYNQYEGALGADSFASGGMHSSVGEYNTVTSGEYGNEIGRVESMGALGSMGAIGTIIEESPVESTWQTSWETSTSHSDHGGMSSGVIGGTGTQDFSGGNWIEVGSAGAASYGSSIVESGIISSGPASMDVTDDGVAIVKTIPMDSGESAANVSYDPTATSSSFESTFASSGTIDGVRIAETYPVEVGIKSVANNALDISLPTPTAPPPSIRPIKPVTASTPIPPPAPIPAPPPIRPIRAIRPVPVPPPAPAAASILKGGTTDSLGKRVATYKTVEKLWELRDLEDRRLQLNRELESVEKLIVGRSSDGSQEMLQLLKLMKQEKSDELTAIMTRRSGEFGITTPNQVTVEPSNISVYELP